MAAAAVASAVTLVILKLVNKSKEGCCECVEEPCCEEAPAVEEVPEEYADFADVQTAE